MLMGRRLLKVAGPIFVTVAAILVASCAAQQTREKTFASPGQASQALYDAVRHDDADEVQAILGATPEVVSPDKEEDEDKLERQRFVEKYQEMHRLVREPGGFTVLYVGAENWPFPIPLVQAGNRWQFDSGSGAHEILARRIGENETLAIHVCQAISRANAPDANAAAADGAIVAFAQNLAKPDTAKAPSESFHGYYFQRLGVQLAGVVVVAYPANYRASGVKTFIVAGGEVYEKDLGPQTALVAQNIKGNYVENWNRVQ